jgi:hypothetical protein
MTSLSCSMKMMVIMVKIKEKIELILFINQFLVEN